MLDDDKDVDAIPSRDDVIFEKQDFRLDDHNFIQRGYMIECDGDCPWHRAHGHQLPYGKMLTSNGGTYTIVDE